MRAFVFLLCTMTPLPQHLSGRTFITPNETYTKTICEKYYDDFFTLCFNYMSIKRDEFFLYYYVLLF